MNTVLTPSIYLIFFFYLFYHHPDLLSFPTRRSSDLLYRADGLKMLQGDPLTGNSKDPKARGVPRNTPETGEPVARRADRKSTRLNSSHLGISYAVFCLKKKKNKNTEETK